MDSNQFLVGLVGSISRLEFGRRHVVEVLVQPLRVEPVDPREGGQLDVVDVAPRPLSGSSDELALVGGVDRLGQRVVVRVADASDGRNGSEFVEVLAIAN